MATKMVTAWSTDNSLMQNVLCIQLDTVETTEKHGHFFHKKVLCKGIHIHVGYFMYSVRNSVFTREESNEWKPWDFWYKDNICLK